MIAVKFGPIYLCVDSAGIILIIFHTSSKSGQCNRDVVNCLLQLPAANCKFRNKTFPHINQINGQRSTLYATFGGLFQAQG